MFLIFMGKIEECMIVDIDQIVEIWIWFKFD